MAAAAHASFAYPRYPKTDPPIRSVRLQLSSGLIEFAIKHWSRGQIAGGHCTAEVAVICFDIRFSYRCSVSDMVHKQYRRCHRPISSDTLALPDRRRWEKRRGG